MSTEPHDPPARPVRPHLGAVYRQKDTGVEYTLSGRRSGNTLFLAEHPFGNGRIIDRLSLPDLGSQFDYVRCNHEKFCCSEHRVHATPHLGCMMR